MISSLIGQQASASSVKSPSSFPVSCERRKMSSVEHTRDALSLDVQAAPELWQHPFVGAPIQAAHRFVLSPSRLRETRRSTRARAERSLQGTRARSQLSESRQNRLDLCQ